MQLALTPRKSYVKTVPGFSHIVRDLGCGAKAKSIRDGNPVALQARGASAVNQAIKSVTIARGYPAADGLDCLCVPAFMTIELIGVERTAVRFQINLPGRPFPNVLQPPEDGWNCALIGAQQAARAE